MSVFTVRLTAALIVTLAAPVVLADELDLSVNDDAARLNYAWAHPSRALRVDGSWLHHQDNGDVFGLGFHVVGDASSGEEPLVGGIGGKVFHISPDEGPLDATVVALGGFLRYTLPAYDRFNLYGHLYYAPDVLAFGDGDRYREIEARVGYNVLRNADVFVGARYSNTRFDPDGELTTDTGLHIGIQLRF